MSETDRQPGLQPKDPPKDAVEALGVLQLVNELEARQFLGAQPLEDSYSKIYASRAVRPILEVVTRTLGMYDTERDAFEPTFFDHSRKDMVEAELAEFDAELEKYVKDRSDESALHTYMEVADIIFQKVAISQRQKTASGDESLRIEGVQQLFSFVIDRYIKPKLQEAGLDFVQAQRVAKIKYGVRARLNTLGYKGKHAALEDRLCLAELKAWKNIDAASQPEHVANELSFSSVGQLMEAIESDSWNVLVKDPLDDEVNLESLARQKYGGKIDERLVEKVDFRRARPIVGSGSIAERTLGFNPARGSGFAETYRDHVDGRGQTKDTDVVQFEKAMKGYQEVRQKQELNNVEDADELVHHKAVLLRRAASFLWQSAVTKVAHTESSDRETTLALLEQRRKINDLMLKHMCRIDPQLVERAAKLIFATRIVTEKSEPLEQAMCEMLVRELEDEPMEVSQVD